jgi:sigma-B regulation protein RsbU (phosphoserine phosphatase)
VDDTPANLRLLSEMLAGHDFRVRPVPDGALALAAVRAQAPDLILLDIRMPEISGYEVCEQLKADARTADIPIIFISALDAVQDKIRAFSTGGVDYVTKPFRVEEVLARVETHLALRKLQKRLQEANQKMAQELALAGEVQTSFLPREVPDIPGWQLSVALRPARETSGDFYDLIPLPGGLLGIVVADVVDKGVGSALYMALSCTLLRTFAPLYPDQPEMAVAAANQRILDDTKSNRFATVLYGVLDPATGALVYCNAGHSVPYLFRSSGSVEALELTGVPMGLFSGETWGRAGVQLAPGDVLVLYTDGIPEARDETGAFFEEAGLTACVEECLDRAAAEGPSAGEVQEAVMAAVCAFMGDAPQADDITLAVVVREPAGSP